MQDKCCPTCGAPMGEAEEKDEAEAPMDAKSKATYDVLGELVELMQSMPRDEISKLKK